MRACEKCPALTEARSREAVERTERVGTIGRDEMDVTRGILHEGKALGKLARGLKLRVDDPSAGLVDIAPLTLGVCVGARLHRHEVARENAGHDEHGVSIALRKATTQAAQAQRHRVAGHTAHRLKLWLDDQGASLVYKAPQARPRAIKGVVESGIQIRGGVRGSLGCSALAGRVPSIRPRQVQTTGKAQYSRGKCGKSAQADSLTTRHGRNWLMQIVDSNAHAMPPTQTTLHQSIRIVRRLETGSSTVRR